MLWLWITLSVIGSLIAGAATVLAFFDSDFIEDHPVWTLLTFFLWPLFYPFILIALISVGIKEGLQCGAEVIERREKLIQKKKEEAEALVKRLEERSM